MNFENYSGDVNDLNFKIYLDLSEQIKPEKNDFSLNLDDDNNQNTTKSNNQNKPMTQYSGDSINSIKTIFKVYPININNNNKLDDISNNNNDFDKKSDIIQKRTYDEKEQDENLKKKRVDNSIQEKEDKGPIPNNQNKIIKKISKPGRNTLKNNYPVHTKFNSDNCRIKIKSHFHNFIIDFFNKLIKINFGKQTYKFRKLPYYLTKNGSKKYNKLLINTKIRDLLNMNISNKYKNINISQNQNTFNKSKFLKKDFNHLLDMEYKEFYKKIYLPSDKPDVEEFNKRYEIDKKTIKGEFNQIFNKNNKKNDIVSSDYEDKIKKVAKYEFIDYFLSINNLTYDY
jgi:hypothetical protein